MLKYAARGPSKLLHRDFQAFAVEPEGKYLLGLKGNVCFYFTAKHFPSFWPLTSSRQACLFEGNAIYNQDIPSCVHWARGSFLETKWLLGFSSKRRIFGHF